MVVVLMSCVGDEEGDRSGDIRVIMLYGGGCSCSMVAVVVWWWISNKKNQLNLNDEDAVLASQWDMCNSVVLSWILGSISEDLYSGQIYSIVASVVWNELKDTYDKVDGSNIFNLHMKINSLKQNAANVAQEQTKILRLNQFLMRLDDEFMQIRSNILLRDPIPDAKTAFAVISREESHRRFVSSHVSSKSQNTVFMSQFGNTGSNQSYNSRNRNNRGPNPNLECTKCNKIGHTIDRCFEVVGYPPHYKKPSNNNKSFRSNNSVVTNSTNESSSSDGLSSVPSSSLSLTNDQMTKLLSLLNDTPAQSSNACNNIEGWIIDSGANQHMTVSEKNLFNVVDISDFNLKVSHPNGTEARVRKIGDLKLTTKIFLHDVLVVPGYCVSLLSVSKMAADNDMYVRLGHPSSPVLHVLKDKLNLNSKDCDFPCETCLKAKQTRDVFQNSDHKVVWVYMLKHKSDVYDTVSNLFNLIQTQFNKKVKVIRTDNGSEFCNNQMDPLILSLGIIHQTTIPYTPQQNGVVERKHIHLLNVARTPSKILAGKSPFEMVHGFEPNLSHLKSFGCLVFSKVLNESDKFSSKSEKAVFIGYSSSKKGYNLWSLERKIIFYSRDVKFFENVFPFKLISSKDVDFNDDSLNTQNFFDLYFFEKDAKVNKNPNDEGRGVSNEVIQVAEATGSTSSVGGGSLDNLNDDNNIPEGNSHDQTDISENIVPASIRRSDRVSVLSRKFDDFIIEGKVKYGLEKVINYANISHENFCFTTSLNKSIEPKHYHQGASDPNWIAAMNDEMQALFRNNTWILTDLL
ncbi:uncharacterized protein [Rutidosis leptorrhynchoides]|uniref:uncharacterized protein n=1 Tax=Rutidosis leptorrhynchoides TaxID=125765 RepID=UPI003A9996C7